MKLGLTDEEICALRGLDVSDEYPPTLAHHRDIAKLQLKKVMEWGNEPCDEHTVGIRAKLKRHQCIECWQALLEEVRE